jgi:type II restriction/modification system DNA methylase subunit YeeA
MNSVQIEENVNNLLQNFLSHDVSRDDFIYELLLSYGHRKSVVGRVKTGERNLSKVDGEVILKRHLFFKPCTSDLFAEIDALKKSKLVLSNKIRFVVVTDFNQLIAVDMKTQDTLDIELNQLPKHFDFFLPWAGTEKLVYRGENPADVKAAEKMADLFDLIKEINYPAKPDKEQLHELVVFLNRLLFCFFSEDTKIFDQNQFSNLISLHTQEDGSDLSTTLERLFKVLNTAAHRRSGLPQYLQSFKYVNGGLFNSKVKVPTLNAKARRMLLDSGKLDWSDINPDIFGSMIQGVADAKTRSNMGMHYTSVTNIMKVIEPLFLNNFYEEFDKCKDNINKLKKLQVRLSRIKIFDPACGSGNFLIIAYKEIRQLEIEVLKRIQEVEQASQSGVIGLFDESHSAIRLDQFYGIELDDFAHEMAVLSLWLVEHQMNMIFETEFGYTSPTLPLKQSGKIVAGNAARVDWESVCPVDKFDEVYLLGNPPYLGGKYQSQEQKLDMKHVFSGVKKFGELDYIACWFYKACKFIKNTDGVFSFVSTNSINQGAQVHQLWPLIFELDLEISFAYKPFTWSNNARAKAAVICTILGVRKKTSKVKKLYDLQSSKDVKNISAYLKEGSNTIVHQSLKPISGMPTILTGNSPYDGGNLILSKEAKDSLLDAYPSAQRFIKKLCGAQDFLNGKERWCLWIGQDEQEEASLIPPINERINSVRDFRVSGGDVARGLANRPYRFRYIHQAKEHLIIIPRVSSERRDYIPFGFLDSETIVSDSAQAIYDPETWVFGILSSRMHMSWVRLTAGRLKSDYRYSSAMCYNTFPLPELNSMGKDEITDATLGVIAAREEHADMSLAELYDPNKMPNDLRYAHDSLNLIVEKIFCGKAIPKEEKRTEMLLKMYEELTELTNA